MTARGFSLVEVVVSMLVVSVLFVAALSTVSASRATRVIVADRARGDQLASDLMSEVLSKPYTDPYYKSGMGPGSDELATGDRSLFDDADDYLGWKASPPQSKDGTEISGYDGWSREVAVAWINPANPAASASDADDAKLITVTVKNGSRVVAQQRAVRTEAWTSLVDEGGLP